MSGIYEEGRDCCLVLFTKPPRPGRVKTRLIGDLTAEQAAELHLAFLGDGIENLAMGRFCLRIGWALEPGEQPLWDQPPGEAQRGADLGERLYNGLGSVARDFSFVAAVGSDLPTLEASRVEQAFRCLEAGADVVLGPVEDGGYYLIALRRAALRPELFAGVSWSTERVLRETLLRCQTLGFKTELLPRERDIDTPPDLVALAGVLARGSGSCPRTRALLAEWGRLPAGPGLEEVS